MALPKLYDRTIWHNNTTPAINEDNLNAMSKGLDDVDDRLIDLAGTIMEDVPAIQHDLEILEPAIESIDANVTRAETAADDAEDSALKSEGYAIGEQDGVEVGPESEYYQKNAKYYAEIANPPIENTVDFTDVIAISDAINKAAKDVRLKVEAVQDLHGYNNPWVGGAGKNVLPITVASIKDANGGANTWSGNEKTIGNVKFTINTDSDGNFKSVSMKGTASNTLWFSLFTPASKKFGISGSYILSGCPSGGTASTYRFNIYDRGTDDATDYTVYSDYGSGTTINFDSTHYYRCMFQIYSGKSIDATLYPMVSTSGGTFEPYTNICPITGHDEVNVIRVAKNRLNPLSIVQGNPSNPSAPNRCSTMGDKSIPVNVGDKITISRQSTAIRYALGIVDDNGNTLYDSGWQTNASFSITASRKGYLICGGFSYSDNANIFPTDVRLADFQIEFSEVATAFEPYQGIETTISLNGTRYGGTLDVTSGVLTVKGVHVDLGTLTYEALGTAKTGKSRFKTILSPGAVDSTSANNTSICSQYIPLASGQTYDANAIGYTIGSSSDLVIYDESLASGNASAFKTAMDGVDFVYELATPQTIQLTAAEVYLLYGYNTLFGDCGDISLTYDASGIIHIEEAKLDTETLKTIAAASSDFADFKARIAAL